MTVSSKLKVHTFPIGSYACNCSLVYSEQTKEAIIIDPGNDFEALKQTVESLNLKPKLLLHTHAHFDHIGRSPEARAYFKAPIALHKEDLFLYQALPQQGRYFGQSVGAPEPIDREINDGETYSLDDQSLKNFLTAIHTPGHTPGSCCFYTEATEVPLLFAGDTLFQGSIGRTDLPGGDQHAITRSIKERLYKLPEETGVVAGHGPSTQIAYEKKYNPFVCG
jgi:glyoxylase-like metal-dependent hydrolase (beta-lactamase superfamily II)